MGVGNTKKKTKKVSELAQTLVTMGGSDTVARYPYAGHSMLSRRLSITVNNL